MSKTVNKWGKNLVARNIFSQITHSKWLLSQIKENMTVIEHTAFQSSGEFNFLRNYPEMALIQTDNWDSNLFDILRNSSDKWEMPMAICYIQIPSFQVLKNLKCKWNRRINSLVLTWNHDNPKAKMFCSFVYQNKTQLHTLTVTNHDPEAFYKITKC